MEGDSSLCEETSVHGIALGPAIMLERPLRGHEVDGFGSFVPFQQIRKIGRLQRLAALEASEQKRYNAPWSGQIEIGLAKITTSSKNHNQQQKLKTSIKNHNQQ